MMSQGQLPIAIAHRLLPVLGSLPFFGSLPVLGKNIEGRSPRRSWALQAVGSPGCLWSLGHFPGSGV